MKRVQKFIVLVSLGALFLLGIVLYMHGVSTSITDEDKIYIHKILDETGNKLDVTKNLEGFEREIKIIQLIQKSAFDTAPDKEVLTVDSPREPKDLFEASAAYCGDRSRYMYKALKNMGFEVRYVSIYNDLKDKNFIEVMMMTGKAGAKSHALVEVKTSLGWMAIDSRTHWISLKEDGTPVSITELQKMAQNEQFPKWSDKNKEDMYFLMKQPFHVIYGLYSRHGRFYAPYTPYVPDIGWNDFILNFTK